VKSIHELQSRLEVQVGLYDLLHEPDPVFRAGLIDQASGAEYGMLQERPLMVECDEIDFPHVEVTLQFMGEQKLKPQEVHRGGSVRLIHQNGDVQIT
jgi:hypothetical protein